MNLKPYAARWIRLAALSMMVGASVEAQVPERQLPEADAVFPEAFSMISGLRELSDGRVMIADPLGQALLVVDLAAGVADTIGRVGGGPGEYKQPDGVFPLPGDSTLLVDLGNGRLTVIGPDLEFGETTPIAQGEPRQGAGPGGGMMIVLPRATDSRGGVYFQPMGGMRPGGGPPDSAAVVRWDRGTGAMDTVAMIKLQDLDVQTSGGAGNRNMMIRPKPFSPQDGWAAGWNGMVAAVRSNTYYLEWFGRDGASARSSEVEVTPVRIRQADKEEYVDRISSDGLRVQMTVNNGVRQMGFSRGGGGGRRPDTDGYEWPDTKPAFDAGRVWVTPEGDAWVTRFVSAGAAPMIDVFDAEGNHKETLILPVGRRIVGFGAAHVYLAATDEFDLQWLERYRRTT
jgi:hypothetical protein